MTDLTDRAEARFLRALEAAGARDPRDFYRERLRELREADPSGFAQATRYYREVLIPGVADEATDPLDEWLEYGRLLASLLAPGETVRIDPSGRATPYERPVGRDSLVLHLPASSRQPALAVGLPPELSQAQRATFDLLVRRPQR